MARHQSRLRKALKSREIRHQATVLGFHVAPSVLRARHFYHRAAPIEAVARRALFHDAQQIDRPLTDAQIDFIRRHAAQNDAPYAEDYWRPPWRFEHVFYELEDVWMTGHTGNLVDPRRNAVINNDGETPDRNRDRVARLTATRPIEAVALPARRYSSYFHFTLDIALPFVAYFESGAAIDAPHVILHAPDSPAFAQETLKAIAAAYDVELRALDPAAKTLCARAVFYRRSRPAADWYGAKPETARRLRDILLAHFGRDPAPAHAGLYLERAGAKLRNLRNAEEVRAAARAAGLRVFQPEAGNFADQVALSAGARAFFGVHGAAMTNILFAPPGAKVVEVFGRNFAKSVYLALAHMLGHAHTPVLGGADDGRQNFAADIDAVAHALS